MFDFSNLIKKSIDGMTDFLLGDSMGDGSGDSYTAYEPKSRTGGFLDTLRGGLKKTMEQGEAREEQQEQLRHRQQPGSGVSSRPAFQAERMRAINPLFNNPYAQKAIRNLSSRAYANPDMNSVAREMRVAMNLRQGRRNIGVEPARAPRVTKTAAASVRKEPKVVT